MDSRVIVGCMNLKSRILICFTFLAAFSVRADPAPTQLLVAKLGIGGNCNLLLDTTNGQQISGIDFNCASSLFGDRHIDWAALVATGGASLADKPCSNSVKISIDPATSNPATLVNGKLVYQTRCKSGSTAELDFDVKWVGTTWIFESKGAEAYCLNISSVLFFSPGITNIVPDPSSTCSK